MGNKLITKIKGEYEKQVMIPKPILINLFSQLELEDLPKIARCCKQFYFVLQSEEFWKKMVLENEKIDQQKVEEMLKEISYQQIYKNSFGPWQEDLSLQKHLKFEGYKVTHQGLYNLTAAFTRKKFVTGQQNVLFTFQMKVDNDNFHEMGICNSSA